MSLVRSVSLFSILVCLPLSASTHVWTGAVSERFSDSGNWIGGSPAGDSDAEISFPGGARLVAINDIDGLNVTGISISGSGYLIGGRAIRFGEGWINDAGGNTRITADIVVGTALDLFATHAEGLTLDSAISGAGSITKSGSGGVTFSGARANTYGGGTRVVEGELRLAKNPGLASIPGTLAIEGGAGYGLVGGRVESRTGEQIANVAPVVLRSGGTLLALTNETIGTLTFAFSGMVDGPLIPSSSINILNEADESGNRGLELRNAVLTGLRTVTLGPNLPMATIVFDRLSGSGGLTIEGGAPQPGTSLDIRNSDYTGGTRINGGTVRITNPETNVTLTGGSITGRMKSLQASGGEVLPGGYPSVAVSGAVSLAGSFTLEAKLGLYSLAIEAHGPVSLGGAQLELSSASRPPGAVYTVIRKDSAGAVSGTFAGLPEGAVTSDGFRISYVGGDGNDVTITDVGPYGSGVQFNGSVTDEGNPVTLQALVFSNEPVTGTVTFLSGTTVLGTATLDGGASSLTITLPAGRHEITAQYNGSPRAYPSSTTATVLVVPRAPVLTSISPTKVQNGATVGITVTGSGFRAGSTIYAGGGSCAATFVSSTSLRCDLTVAVHGATSDTPVQIKLAEPFEYVTSNTLALRVEVPSVPPPPPATISFQTNSITANVTPGARVAWISRAGRLVGQRPVTEFRTAITEDSDQNGSAIWEQGQEIAPYGIWVAVDMTSRELHAVQRGSNTALSPRPFPEDVFVRDPEGEYSHLIVPMNLGAMAYLWVRPGVGAWTRFYTWEGATVDRDGATNGLMFLQTSDLEPIGDSPATPSGVLAGDVFTAIDESGTRWWGDRVDAHLGETVGAGVLGFATATYGPAAFDETETVTVTVMRTGGSDGRVTVQYATEADTAISGLDFVAAAGTLVFEAGEIIKTIAFPLVDDDTYAGQRAFKVRLLNAAGATITAGREETTVSFRDDDPMPVVTVRPSPETVQEGDSGIQQVSFNVDLEGATRLPVPLLWRQSASGTEYAPLIFQPGETRKVVHASYAANRVPDRDRTLSISIIQLENAVAGVHQSMRIVDDDVFTITVSDVTVREGAGEAEVTMTASPAPQYDVVVTYETANGTAVAGTDYTAVNGNVTFKSAVSRRVITIPLVNDSLAESMKWFSLRIVSATSGEIERASARVFVSDDDQPGFVAFTVSAATIDASSILVSWSSVPDASSYILERAIGMGAFVDVGSISGDQYFDRNVQPLAVYRYRVRTQTSAGIFSTPIDTAVAVDFTDDPVIPGMTVFKAAHITELRSAVNAMRAAAGLPAVALTGTVASGGTMLVQHVTALRTGANEARAILGSGAFAFTNPTLSSGAAIRAMHIQELRHAVK
jgi:autotransporter-associated beta strand protein